VRFEATGKIQLLAGHYLPAERSFAAALRHESRSTHARFGLACAFFLTGHRGRSVLELNLALKHGLVLSRAGGCGHSCVFSQGLFAAKFGLIELVTLAQPRVTNGRRDAMESHGFFERHYATNAELRPGSRSDTSI
jgi:hypothetical protein